MELSKRCSNCRTAIPENAAFCPSCGKAVGDEANLQAETYSIVLNLGIGNLERASAGVRMFYHLPAYCAGCSCSDGRLYDSLHIGEIEKVINTVVSQLGCGNPVILCRGLSYDKAVEAVKIFRDRANVFLFCDSDGSTLEEFSHSDPKFKYILENPSLNTEQKNTGIQDKTGFSPHPSRSPKMRKIDAEYLEVLEKLSDSDKKIIQAKVTDICAIGFFIGILTMIMFILFTLNLGFFKIGPWAVTMTFGTNSFSNWSINVID